jgi:hypothetical protein
MERGKSYVPIQARLTWFRLAEERGVQWAEFPKNGVEKWGQIPLSHRPHFALTHFFGNSL